MAELFTRASMGSSAYNEAQTAWQEAMSGNISASGRSANPQQMSFQDWMEKRAGGTTVATAATTAASAAATPTAAAPTPVSGLSAEQARYQSDRASQLQAASAAQAQQAGQQNYLAQLQAQQQSQATQASGATAQAQASATAQGTLGQDVFSQRLAGMATGQFDSSDPSYQWRFQQGQQAVERSQAAQGLLGSGNVAIALQQYGQGAASQEYSAQFARMLQGSQNATSQYTAAYNTLAQMMGQQTGVGQLGNALAGTGVAQGQLGIAQQGVLGNIAQQGINQGTLEHSYYASDLGAQTARYTTDVGAQTSRYATDIGAQTSRYSAELGAASSQYATSTGAQTSRANTAATTGLGYAELAQRAQANAAQQQGMSDLYGLYSSGGLFGNTAGASTGTSSNLWGTANQPQASGSNGGDAWGSWGDSSISITPTELAY